MTWAQTLAFVGFKVSSLVEKGVHFYQRIIAQPLAFHFSWHRELLRFNGCNMSNANNEKMVHLGAKIPAHLAEQIDAIAPYFKGGKSEIVRRALAEGIRIVHEAQMLNFPMQAQR